MQLILLRESDMDLDLEFRDCEKILQDTIREKAASKR